jgi:O-methyltransferase involved in polyketide biosynthesis
MDPEDKVPVELEGVPATALWTLYERAGEARRSDTVIDDPEAVRAVDRIDYPFEERFGRAGGTRAQWQALRATTFDSEIRRFLAEHPDGTVVALGEGLETQFWRVDNERVTWLTVDLPEIVSLRRRLLPREPRVRSIPRSATDRRWLDEVDDGHGVLITAQGLLMYLAPSEVYAIIETCARRFPSGSLLFDAVPGWFDRARTVQARAAGPNGFAIPPVPWTLDARLARQIGASRRIAELRRLTPPRGRGVFNRVVLPVMYRAPVVRWQVLSIWVARFREVPGASGSGRPSPAVRSGG